MNTLANLWKVKDNIALTDIIIGIGIGVTESGRASKLSYAVAKKAAALYKEKLAPKVLLVGGFTQNNISEAEAIKKIVLEEGIPSKNIVLETQSTSTRANADETAKLLNTMNVRKVLIVAQEIHARRVIATFKEFLPKNIVMYWASAPSQYDTVPNQKRLSSKNRFLTWEIFWYCYFKVKGSFNFYR